MGGLLDIGLSILTGGATGLLGTAISGVIDLFQGRQKNAQEVELRKLDIELAKTEGNSAAKVAAVQAEGERDQAEWEAMRASYQEASRRGSMRGESVLLQLAEFVRRITRPGITWLLLGFVVVIYFVLASPEIRAEIVSGTIYLATTAVLWWFGGRQVSKGRMREAQK